MNLPALILFAVIFFVLGLAAALAVMYLRGEARTEAPESEAVPPADGEWANPPDTVETSRIWRDRQSGQVTLELEGKTWQRVEDLDASQRQQVIRLALSLQEWLKPGHLKGKPASPGPAPASATQQADRSGAQPDLSPEKPLAGKLETAKAGWPGGPAEGQQPASQAEQPSSSPLGFVSQTFARYFRPKQASPESMAAQVDAILQELLVESSFAGRYIRLEEAPDQSLVVLVDHDRYDGIQAVPDEEVRALLQTAVARWQQRMTQRS